MGEKGAHDALEIDPVGLRPARPAIDLDARGIDLAADDALVFEPAMQPMSFEARFVTGQILTGKPLSPALARAAASLAPTAAKSPP